MKALAAKALAAALLFLASTAQAQVVEEIRKRAPQLVAFAGSQRNFESLVSGLARVSEVRLETDLGNGYTQFVSFTPPGGPLAADRIIDVLQAARERLADFGVRNPTAREVAAALLGGFIERPTGTFRLRGTLPQSGQGFERDYTSRTVYTGSPQLERFAGSAANLEALIDGLTRGTPIALTGTSRAGLPETATFRVPIPPTTRAEAINLLQLARRTLARHGIVAPTPLQVRAALLGGRLRTDAGSLDLAGAIESRRGLPRSEPYPP